MVHSWSCPSLTLREKPYAAYYPIKSLRRLTPTWVLLTPDVLMTRLPHNKITGVFDPAHMVTIVMMMMMMMTTTTTTMMMMMTTTMRRRRIISNSNTASRIKARIFRSLTTLATKQEWQTTWSASHGDFPLPLSLPCLIFCVGDCGFASRALGRRGREGLLQ